MVLRHTVLTDTAGIGAAEKLQGPLVALAGPPLDVPERVHQPVVVKLGVLQVRPEVSFTVRHQAGEAGLKGPAGALNTGVTHHIVGAQRFLLHLHLFFCTTFLLSVFQLVLRLLGVFRLRRVLLDLGVLGCCGVWTLLFCALCRSLCSVVLGALSRLRLAGAQLTPGASFGFVPEAGATNRVRAGSRGVSIQHTWADRTQLLRGAGGSFLWYCVCHVFRAQGCFHSYAVWKELVQPLFLVPGSQCRAWKATPMRRMSLRAQFQSICYPPLQHSHSSRQASKEWYTHSPGPPFSGGKEKPRGGACTADREQRCRVAANFQHCVWKNWNLQVCLQTFFYLSPWLSQQDWTVWIKLRKSMRAESEDRRPCDRQGAGVFCSVRGTYGGTLMWSCDRSHVLNQSEIIFISV